MESITNTRVLITGISGYIATNIAYQLLTLGYIVRGTVRSLNNNEKISHLYSLVPNSINKIELVEADLNSEKGWHEAVLNCDYVMHVASPFIIGAKDDQDCIAPAVNGTLFVLKACLGKKVKRVIITSSVVAIESGHPSTKNHFTENDHSISETTLDNYDKSKTLADEVAWKFAKENNLEMASIHPGWVLGPTLIKSDGASVGGIISVM